jgi:hypothetical protein
MITNVRDHSFFRSEIPRKFILNLLTSTKVIALLIFTKFTRNLMEVRHLVYFNKRKTCKIRYNEFKKIFYTSNFGL